MKGQSTASKSRLHTSDALCLDPIRSILIKVLFYSYCLLHYLDRYICKYNEGVISKAVSHLKQSILMTDEGALCKSSVWSHTDAKSFKHEKSEVVSLIKDEGACVGTGSQRSISSFYVWAFHQLCTVRQQQPSLYLSPSTVCFIR